MAGQVKESVPGFKGVRFIRNKTKRLGRGIGNDREFYIRYKRESKLVEEPVGWLSGGMTAAKASTIRETIINNIKLGVHPQSVAEMRQMEQEERVQAELESQERQRLNVPFSIFFENEYFPATKINKSDGSLTAESGLYRKWIKPVLGDISLTSIRYSHLETIMKNMIQAGRSRSTIKYAFAVVSQVWAHGKLKGVCEGESPTRQFKFEKLDNERVRFLTENEAKILLEKLGEHSTDLRDMAIMSLFAGLRAGEIFKLKWVDVNFEAKNIFIRHPKSGYSRFAFINEKIAEVLNRRHTPNTSPSDLVFPTTNGKLRINISHVFRRCVKELRFNDGITDNKQKVVFHTLRHTFASWLVQKNTTLYKVQSLMGHAQSRMTQRYAHLASDDLRDAANSLDGAI